MGLGNERNQQTLGVFLLTQKPDPFISSGLKFIKYIWTG